MKESELQDAIGSLPRSMKPSHDLWPGIDERLGDVGATTTSPLRRRSWHMPAIAAAVMLALTTGILIGRGLGPDASAPGPAAQSLFETALLGTVEATEREYQAAFSELVPLEYSGARLEGADPEALRGTWEDLQEAESSLLSALEQYPTNTYLNAKLLDLRSRQLQFIKQLALLEQNDWRKT